MRRSTPTGRPSVWKRSSQASPYTVMLAGSACCRFGRHGLPDPGIVGLRLGIQKDRNRGQY